MEKERGLVGFCIEAATANSGSVEKWRRQRRTLERLPYHLADALFLRLFQRRLLSPSILELSLTPFLVFQHSVTEVDLRGESSVDAEWLAYLGAFRYLQNLNIADCKSINNTALWPLSGHSSLKELDLSRCSKITDAGIKHLLSIESLEKLCLSEIRLSADGVTHLSSFVNLRVLDLGGIPVTDKALSSLQVLTQLQYLDLWGSEISNIGATTFKKFPILNYLNIAWTRVTRLPNLPITCLNMSKCDIHSIVDKENKDTALLSKLIVTGATFVDADEVFSFLQPGCLKFLDISSSNIVNFNFLVNLHGLEHLDLSYSQITDGLMEQVTSVGENLRYLNLSNTKITSHALSILAGCFPKLENLSLSHSLVDDASLVYISMMPTLRVIDLSYTRIRGFVHSSREKSVKMLSLRELQNLPHLRSLNLEGTKAIDEALQPLSLLTELECLYLKSDFITDISLNTLSSLRKLKFLGFCGGVITDYGLLSYRPPLFCVLDLRGCWLLSANAVYSFCRKHEKVEVRHEHINIPFVDENDSKSPILRLITEKSSKFPTSKSSFIDERIKYSTEELLQLENSPGSSRVLKDLDLMHEILFK